MKITKLVASNVKRIRAIRIEPDGNLVVIQGKNGAGKSSVLDSIWLAIQGAAATRETPDPIRHGETEAMVEVTLGDLVVTRRWNKGKASRLELRDDGVKQRSPQRLLDSLVGRLSFDPLAFAGLKEAEQRRALLDLVELPFDPLELERRRQSAYDARTERNRDVKRLEGQLDGMTEPGPGTPTEPVSVADLLEQHGQATKALDRAGRLQAALSSAKGDARRAQEALAEAEAAVAGLPAVFVDPGAIKQQIDSAEEVNASVRDAAQYGRVEADLETVSVAADDLTHKLEEIDKEKERGLREAQMPVEGLGFSSEGVTFHGVPLVQCCSAERLRVSCAMAMAANPEIRVIRITDGSLLDEANMAMLESMAQEQDYQVWIEVVSEGDGAGVVIEDGEVVA